MITTGGGFSNFYPQPTYQRSAVSGYFSAAASAGQSPVAGYTAAGRGYPDISLAGYAYKVVIGGALYSISGTSASSPAVAAFFSNINAARIASGRGSLGFLNPTLYAYSSKFVIDITSGNNLCSAGDGRTYAVICTVLAMFCVLYLLCYMYRTYAVLYRTYAVLCNILKHFCGHCKTQAVKRPKLSFTSTLRLTFFLFLLFLFVLFQFRTCVVPKDSTRPQDGTPQLAWDP